MKHDIARYGAFVAALGMLACSSSNAPKNQPAPQEAAQPDKAASGDTSSKPAAPPTAALNPGDTGGKPAAPPTAALNPGNLPAYSYESVPGYLGFTVQPADTRSRGWTPAHPSASVVILDADAWSEVAEEGPRFRVLAAEGNLPLTLTGVSQIPYGCNGNPMTMAAFKTPQALAEQVVWILPDSDQRAASVPIEPGPATPKKRTWTVGSLAVTVTAEGPRAGQLRILRGDTQVYESSFTQTPMDGADAAPLDLTNDLEVGVPFPEAVFRLGDNTFLLVLRIVSYEGVSFEVLTAPEGGQGPLRSAGRRYVYLCAF